MRRQLLPAALFTVALLLLGGFRAAIAADEHLIVTGYKDENGFLKPVPVNISGFTGEADVVLKNDLVFEGRDDIGRVAARQNQALRTQGADGQR